MYKFLMEVAIIEGSSTQLARRCCWKWISVCGGRRKFVESLAERGQTSSAVRSGSMMTGRAMSVSSTAQRTNLPPTLCVQEGRGEMESCEAKNEKRRDETAITLGFTLRGFGSLACQT